MRRIGFTGTQHGMTEPQFSALLRLFKVEDNDYEGRVEFHHGDCIGADEEADAEAWGMNWRVILHPPIENRKRAYCESHEERIALPYLVRNHAIVDETEALYATPHGPEELRSGTWATIRYARKAGKPVHIVWPDGTESNE